MTGPRATITGARPARRDDSFASDVLDGLSATPKRVPSKYLYDARGSELFAEITRLDEYYLTACETEILEDCSGEIASFLPRKGIGVVELGAGDGRKTAILLRRLLNEGRGFKYVPVDISRHALRCLTDFCREEFSGNDFEIAALASEYSSAAKAFPAGGGQTLALFLGSTIGNFDPSGARGLLLGLWRAMGPGDMLLIGFDLRKDPGIIQRAYMDSRGVTGEFNLNLLDRINRELGGTFETDSFRYHCFYDPYSGSVESMLVSARAQEAYVGKLGRRFFFDEWEAMHTECSRKFTFGEIQRLAGETGFKVLKTFLDRRRYFADSLWTAVK